MTTPPDDPRTVFERLSAEYAQALQAYEAIETQAPTLLAMGHGDDLRRFIDQFLEMAGHARELAVEKNESNFVEWFGELMAKAEALRETGAGIDSL